MSVSIILAFLPWIGFDLLPKHTHSQMVTAMGIALVLTIATNYKSIRKRYILPCATLVFFGVALIVVWLGNFVWISRNIWAATHLMCAAIAWGSILLQQPFTLQYAKEEVSEQYWTHPTFLRINNILTAAWGMIFVFNFLVNIFKVKLANIGLPLSSVLTNGSTLLGIWLCAWFPEWYHKHQLAKQAALQN